MKKIIFGVVLLSGFVSSSYALEISESMVGKYVGMKFPKSMAGVQVTAPKVTLLEGKANFCALARPKLFPKDIEFCTNLTPQWRQETGSLLGTNMTLLSLNVPGVADKYVEIAKKVINQSVLPALEGTEVYKVDNFIGKRVSTVQVTPGKLNLSF